MVGTTSTKVCRGHESIGLVRIFEVVYDRYSIAKSADDLKNSGIQPFAGWNPQFNAAPTKILPVLIQGDDKTAQPFQWGLMGKMANNQTISPKLFNLPVTNALKKPVYRQVLTTNRCLILADGFYVWKQTGKKQRVPHFCFFKNRALFGIAGFWETFEDTDEQQSNSFNMLTVGADAALSDYQEDMPAIIKVDQFTKWISDDTTIEEIETILNGVSMAQMSVHAVGPKITQFDVNDPSLIEVAAPSDQFGNYTLFS